MKNSLKILLGAAAGAALGMTLGILFAPDKGTTTRKKLSQKGEDYVDELGGKLHEFMDNVNKKMESIKEETNRIVKNGEKKIQTGTKETTTT